MGQLSESDAVDALRLPFYSSRHPTASHGWGNLCDLGNPSFIWGIPVEIIRLTCISLVARGGARGRVSPLIFSPLWEIQGKGDLV